jgi:hypothetical protein
MRRLVLLLAALFASDLDARAVQYPEEGTPIFTLEVPDDWTVEEAAAEGDYLTIETPESAVIALQSRRKTATALEEAIREGHAYIEEHYDEVVLEPEERNLENLNGGYVRRGYGTTKDDATRTRFSLLFLNSTKHVVEAWMVLAPDDEAGGEAVRNVLNSLQINLEY